MDDVTPLKEYFTKCKVVALHNVYGPYCASSYGKIPGQDQNEQDDDDVVIHASATRLVGFDVAKEGKSLLKFRLSDLSEFPNFDYYYFNYFIQSETSDKGEVGGFIFYFNNDQKALYPAIRQEITKYLVQEYNILIDQVNKTIKEAKGKYNDIKPEDRIQFSYYQNFAERLLKKVNDICRLSLEPGFMSRASREAMKRLFKKNNGILLITLLDEDYHLESYYSENKLGEMDHFNDVNSYIADSVTGEVKQLFISLKLLSGWSGKKLQKFIEVRLENQKLPPITEYYVKLPVGDDDYIQHLISTTIIEDKLYYLSVKADQHVTKSQLEKVISSFAEYVIEELMVLVN